jgi:pSer/pThr/pTyr-binding forkhead associated (FHA) protein
MEWAMFQLFDEKHQRRYPLTGLLKEIGRTSECDLCIPDDEKVSRLHARLEWNGNDWVVVDQGSTNGTFVNGEKVQECKLRPGDVLEIGDSQFLYLPLLHDDRGIVKKTTLIGAAKDNPYNKNPQAPSKPRSSQKPRKKP